jgi:hypothetical protein
MRLADGRARRGRTAASRGARLLSAAADEAFHNLFRDEPAPRGRRRRRGADGALRDLSEAEWFAILHAPGEIARPARAARAAPASHHGSAPRDGPAPQNGSAAHDGPALQDGDAPHYGEEGEAPVAASAGDEAVSARALRAWRMADASFAAGNPQKAAEQAGRTIAYLAQREFRKATIAAAAETALRADAESAPPVLTAELAAGSLKLSDAYGCAPAQAISALILTRCALHRDDFQTAREMMNRALAAQKDCAPHVHIAVADVQADLSQRVGNFDRARALLGERLQLERRLASTPRALRNARAFYQVDLARIEMVEAIHRTGVNARENGRRAERLLRDGLAVFQIERDASALALGYTRLAMAVVLQRRLSRARKFAARGRAFAERAHSVDLIAAADDLLRRIEAKRGQSRFWAIDRARLSA